MARSEGIVARHARSCAKTGRDTARCSCSPAYRVRVDIPAGKGGRTRKSRTFTSRAEAAAWRADALREVRLGLLRAQTGATFREAADAFIVGARDGSIVTRSGQPYKPSAVRDYEQVLRLRLVPAFGAVKLADVTRAELQKVVGRMRKDGLSPSSIRRTINAARALYRNAIQHDEVMCDPTDHLALPAVVGRRERVAAPAEATLLLSALNETDRAFWATALYAGLRLGELRALRWQDVDLDGDVIRVERSMDARGGIITPKTVHGHRTVPLARALRGPLAAHRLRVADASPDVLVFGGGGRPFNPSSLTQRADRAWKKACLRRITPHECRHSYASFMIAAGVNAKQLSTWMGHASINITLDRYGHLFPGAEAEGAARLDQYLASAL